MINIFLNVSTLMRLVLYDSTEKQRHLSQGKCKKLGAYMYICATFN